MVQKTRGKLIQAAHPKNGHMVHILYKERSIRLEPQKKHKLDFSIPLACNKYQLPTDPQLCGLEGRDFPMSHVRSLFNDQREKWENKTIQNTELSLDHKP